MNDLPVVLFVDDDPMLLSTVRLVLGSRMNVHVAPSPDAAEVILQEHDEIEVVVSDLKMPEVDGVQFLEYIAGTYPHIVRLMMTGIQDQSTTVSAINRAGVYRYVVKPTPPNELYTILKLASKFQREQRRAEIQHEKRLGGSLQVLANLLHSAAPALWNLSDRTAELTKTVAEHIGCEHPDRVGMLAKFALAGFAVADQSVLRSYATGAAKNHAMDLELVKTVGLSRTLLNSVPELENSLPWLDQLFQVGDKENNDLEVRLIETVFEIERLAQQGSRLYALSCLINRTESPEQRELLLQIEEKLHTKRTVSEIMVTKLEPGMVLARPVVTENLQCLLAENTVLTQTLIKRLASYQGTSDSTGSVVAVFEEHVGSNAA